MIPLAISTGSGCHESSIAVESNTVAVTLVGAVLGTVNIKIL